MGTIFLILFLALATVMFLQRFGVIDSMRGIRNLEPYHARDMVDKQDAVILDVRSREDWEAARIPESRHMPLIQMANRINELEEIKGKSVILSCRSGRTSAKACLLLKKHGYDAYNLKGGLAGWASHKYPLELNGSAGRRS